MASHPTHWRDDQARELFVSSGISAGPARWWGTFYRKPNGSLKRLVSRHLPMRRDRDQAQAELDAWAMTKRYEPIRPSLTPNS